MCQDLIFPLHRNITRPNRTYHWWRLSKIIGKQSCELICVEIVALLTKINTSMSILEKTVLYSHIHMLPLCERGFIGSSFTTNNLLPANVHFLTSWTTQILNISIHLNATFASLGLQTSGPYILLLENSACNAHTPSAEVVFNGVFLGKWELKIESRIQLIFSLEWAKPKFANTADLLFFSSQGSFSTVPQFRHWWENISGWKVLDRIQNFFNPMSYTPFYGRIPVQAVLVGHGNVST